MHADTQDPMWTVQRSVHWPGNTRHGEALTEHNPARHNANVA